ncbi:MAG: Holliday junction branch migration protein RuvA [Ignavibacteriales bacterium]|nr:Holliday junction branch migration protein RuvA [Ignavibacteriales bacterium]
MISHIRGKLVHKSPTEIVIDVNGVGYQVNIPLSTFEKIDKLDGEVNILTYMHVREDAMILYGFATEAERDIFKMLISISGIGPKIAQGILSGINTNELREAVLMNNIEALTSISGVGRKTAERIILELKNKLGKVEITEPAITPTSIQLKARAEAVIALMSLGFNRTSAEQALRTVLSESSNKELSVEEMIKRALHHSSK